MNHEAPEGFEPLILGEGFSTILGPVFVDRTTGRLRMYVARNHHNPVGMLHGGAMATFADMQIAAIRGGAEEGHPHQATISLSVDFIAPVPLGSWMEAQVTLVKTTRSMVFTQAIISVDGKPVARSHAIYNNRNRNSGND